MAIFSDAFQTQILFSFYSILALLSSLTYEKGLRARAPCFIVCCEGVWCNAHGTFCKLLSTTNTFCYLSFQISPISNPPLQCVLWCLLIDPSALSTCVVPEKCIQVIWRDLYLASVQWLSHFSCFCQPLYSLKVGVSWYIDGRPKISPSYNTESAAMWTKINHIPHRVQTLWRNLRWFLKGCFGGIKLELAKKKKRSFPDVQPGKPQVQVNQQTSCLVWDGARSTCPHITPSWLNLWPCLPSDVAVLELIQGETLLPIESRACPGALVDFAWVTCPGFLVQTCSWV